MKRTGKSLHKAVAPIIATLLMVAIAVVGGILIFVFTQGFFSDADTASQTIDKFEIIGYDFRDKDNVDELLEHTGELVAGGGVDAGMDVDGGLNPGDYGLVYVTNLSDHPISLIRLEVGGVSYFHSGDQSGAFQVTATVPPGDRFLVCNSATCFGPGSLGYPLNGGFGDPVEPNVTVSIIFQVGTNDMDLKNGRGAQILVHTDNDGLATYSAKVGKQKGS